jgi:hypothetical protein
MRLRRSRAVYREPLRLQRRPLHPTGSTEARLRSQTCDRRGLGRSTRHDSRSPCTPHSARPTARPCLPNDAEASATRASIARSSPLGASDAIRLAPNVLAVRQPPPVPHKKLSVSGQHTETTIAEQSAPSQQPLVLTQTLPAEHPAASGLAPASAALSAQDGRHAGLSLVLPYCAHVSVAEHIGGAPFPGCEDALQERTPAPPSKSIPTSPHIRCLTMS